jgi:hypothetical protein
VQNTCFTILLLFFCLTAKAQTARVNGSLKDELGKPVIDANIILKGFNKGTVSDLNGEFKLEVPVNQPITLQVSHTRFKREELQLKLTPGEEKELIINLEYRTLDTFTVTSKTEKPGMTKIPIIKGSALPTPTGNIEDIIKSIGLGVSSNNELSSAYNVRGGNFDENLIYVNDIEIYRPFLVRSGQQEGLSFINSDLVDEISFSSGGFEARYGDKLSSVLDVKYRNPNGFKTSATASFMGVNFHLEDVSKSLRWSHLTGVRFRSNSYLLNSLEVKGDYRPIFADAQTLIRFHQTENVTHSFFGYYSYNKYRFVPQTRETSFGTINEALRLTIFFDGQEINSFETMLGAFTTEINKKDNRYKFILSSTRSRESERFDVLGQYYLDELERDLGSDDFGDVKFNRGIGGFLDHARNQLNASIYSAAFKAEKDIRKGTLFYGANVQHERINDRMNEWILIDSAGYSRPRPIDSVGYTDPSAQPYQYLDLYYNLKTRNQTNSTRAHGYVQYSGGKSHMKNITITSPTGVDTTFESYSFFNYNIGLRAHYWGLNNQLVGGPRAQFNFKPRLYGFAEDSMVRRNLELRFASGIYHQPPFYREIRGIDGFLNPEVLAQSSIHFVLGSDYVFNMWDRPFKFTSELYYKHLGYINPYKVDNVRIRYLANNDAKGYAYGVDFKINGEFVKGVESWATLSYLKTEEDIFNDFFYQYFNSDGALIEPGFTANSVAVDSVRVEPGFIPRPTDQRLGFSIFFQDQMPSEWNTEKVRWDSFRVSVNLMFGSRLPYGPPGSERYKDIIRSGMYRRVDLGLIKEILRNKDQLREGSFWKKVESAFVSLEVFNLLDINNAVNYTWVQDVNGRQYAVPNFLTPRRLNLKFTMNF